MIGIYKITSPSKKIYIGSSVDIDNRWASYKRLHCKAQIKLYNSFIKYGVDAHKFEIITECESNKLLELECYYGNLYNVLNSKLGLNCKLPKKDDNFTAMSDSTKKKISIANKGKKHSEETKQYLRELNTGNKHTKESIEKIRYASKNISIETRKKISESSRGRKKSEKTLQILRDKRKLLTKESRIKMSESLLKNSKILLDTEYGIYYYGIMQAEKSYKYNRSTLRKYLNGQIKNKTNLIITNEP